MPISKQCANCAANSHYACYRYYSKMICKCPCRFYTRFPLILSVIAIVVSVGLLIERVVG